MFRALKRFCSGFIIAVLITVHLSFAFPEPALAAPWDFVQPNKIFKVLSNKSLLKDMKRLLNTTPATFCRAYDNKLAGIDASQWEFIEEAATSSFVISQAIGSATAAGAGTLAGYAGMASAISQLGLGGVTTAIAGLLGSSTAGAAATAVVTSAVGGPAIMGVLIAGGTGAAAVGTYKLGQFTVEKFDNWAANYCNLR